ncbi:hypothetical protein Mycsm_07239 (plasmid) [Mycobacterium sp. JS623]|uniref:hypothetical protein n=1 Tax=Mycobacterium sp. JS623 TaxID=212767 RepID=UPI0002A55D17|nr:hypothetical protein [Mycobacterium sp. JS623]AGB27333.1 hypothetical protein Mycsm_07239 [Mycobacterium sp. JS623]
MTHDTLAVNHRLIGLEATDSDPPSDVRRFSPRHPAQETHQLMAPTTITFRTDRGVISYSALERPQSDEPGGIAGGLLGGEPALVAIVREILAGSLPKSVRVAEPNLDYVFTPGRDTAADVAAAMLVAGNGRGRLSDAGWDALDAAMTDQPERGPDSPAIH